MTPITIYYTTETRRGPTTRELLHSSTLVGADWGQSVPIPAVNAAGAPSAVEFRGDTFVFYAPEEPYRGLGHKCLYMQSKGQGWRKSSLDAWRSEQEIPDTGTSFSPGAVVYRDRIYLIHYGMPVKPGRNDEYHQIWYNIFDGEKWGVDQKLPNTDGTGSLSAAVFGGKIYVVHPGGHDDEDDIWMNAFDGDKWTGDVRQAKGRHPALLVHDGRLLLFWREGGELYYSDRQGDGWGRRTMVMGGMSGDAAYAVHSREDGMLIVTNGGNAGHLLEYSFYVESMPLTRAVPQTPSVWGVG